MIDDNQVQINVSEHMSVPEVAEALGVHPNTLRRWAQDGIGPRPFIFGARSIRYLRREVEEYARGGRHE